MATIQEALERQKSKALDDRAFILVQTEKYKDMDDDKVVESFMEKGEMGSISERKIRAKDMKAATTQKLKDNDHLLECIELAIKSNK